MGRVSRVVFAVGVAVLLAVVGLSRCTATDHSEGAAEVIATGLDVPWGLDFLPNGDALVAERPTGRIYRIPAGGGEPVHVGTVPGVSDVGEGGLLGLAVNPLYIHDQMIYAYLTTDTDNRIIRFHLVPDDTTIVDVQVVVDGIAKSGVHNGGALAFGPDGMLYAGTGDAGDPSRAQDPTSLNGKILRIDPVGVPPRAAPNPDPDSFVWSMGHRNVQGLTWDDDARLWATEFGQNEFDEVNLIEPGGNYGWPEVEGTGDVPSYVNPRVTWTTDEASPSGAAYLDGALYVGALRGQRLWRVPLDGGDAGEPEALLTGDYGRLRNVVAGPDGQLWITTSNRDGRGEFDDDDDRVLRLDPDQ